MSNIPFSTHFQAWDDYVPTPQSSGDGYSAFCTSPTSIATSIDDVNDFQLSAEHDMQKAASVDPYTGLGDSFLMENGYTSPYQTDLCWTLREDTIASDAAAFPGWFPGSTTPADLSPTQVDLAQTHQPSLAETRSVFDSVMGENLVNFPGTLPEIGQTLKVAQTYWPPPDQPQLPATWVIDPTIGNSILPASGSFPKAGQTASEKTYPAQFASYKANKPRKIGGAMYAAQNIPSGDVKGTYAGYGFPNGVGYVDGAAVPLTTVAPSELMDMVSHTNVDTSEPTNAARSSSGQHLFDHFASQEEKHMSDLPGCVPVGGGADLNLNLNLHNASASRSGTVPTVNGDAGSSKRKRKDAKAKAQKKVRQTMTAATTSRTSAMEVALGPGAMSAPGVGVAMAANGAGMVTAPAAGPVVVGVAATVPQPRGKNPSYTHCPLLPPCGKKISVKHIGGFKKHIAEDHLALVDQCACACESLVRKRTDSNCMEQCNHGAVCLGPNACPKLAEHVWDGRKPWVDCTWCGRTFTRGDNTDKRHVAECTGPTGADTPGPKPTRWHHDFGVAHRQ